MTLLPADVAWNEGRYRAAESEKLESKVREMLGLVEQIDREVLGGLMPASSSQTARELVERVLREMFQGAQLIIEPAAGGFLVGVVRSDFSTYPGRNVELDVLKRVAQESGGIPDPSDRAVVFKVAFYPDEKAVYAEDSILRVHRATYKGHVRIPQPSPRDAHVSAHELEAEALSIDPQSRFSCHVRPVDPSGKVLTPYVEFDLLGMALDVHHVEDVGDGTWVVHVGTAA